MRRNRHLVSNASRLALALLLVAQPLTTAPVLAQAFQGAAVFDANKIAISNGSGTASIAALARQSTINWTPADTATGGGAINFLPAGKSVTYTTGLTGPVTVLNRIIAADPSRQIGLYGNVNAQANVGVWFYAPGGVLVGSTARFNVGSLLLTAGDPVVDGDGKFIAAGNRFKLSAATQTGAAIDIAAGAQINALQGAGSYVIAVAPRITQAGAIQVDGSAALVAADAVDFTLNAGLFDITVTQGTSAAGTVVTHSGETRGPAAAAGAGNRIYMVAVPRNDAITMLVSGGSKLGFAIAGAANVDGNTVVLSAGHDIVGTPSGPSPASPFADRPVNATDASIIIRNGDYSSAVTARATTTARIDLSSGNLPVQANFASDLTLRGGAEALVAGNTGTGGRGAALNVAGNLLVSAETALATLSGAAAGSGGTAQLTLGSGLTVNIGGNAVFNADGAGGPGGPGIGGTAAIVGNGGSLTVAGNLGLSATGRGPAATGGSALLSVNGGQVMLGGSLTLAALGVAEGVRGSQTSATGGTATLSYDGGTLSVAGSSNFDASASGGAATGGNAGIIGAESNPRAPATLGFTGAVTLNANALVDGAQTGGFGQGGDVRFIIAPRATVTAAADLTLTAAAAMRPGSVGPVQGGEVTLRNFGTTNVTGMTTLDASALAAAAVSTNGSDATSGAVALHASAGTLTLGTLTARIGATAGNSDTGIGGQATGGALLISNNNGNGSGGALSASGYELSGAIVAGTGATGGNALGASFILSIFGTNFSLGVPLGLSFLTTGGDGGANDLAGNGGNASGAAVQVLLSGGATYALPDMIAANARGGRGFGNGTGGDGIGGQINLRVSGAATSFAASSLTLAANGFGGAGGSSGAGGAGTGGLVEILAGSGSTLAVSGGVTLQANGFGSNATAGAGGVGSGGLVLLDVGTGGNLDIGGTTKLDADARGGNGISGGAATGGSARMGFGNRNVTLRAGVIVSSNAGAGSGSDLAGGSARGGTAEIDGAGSGALAISGSLAVSAQAVGGGSAAANGGSATGGQAVVGVAGGTLTVAGGLDLAAGAGGGGGLFGGSAGAGKTELRVGEGGSVTSTSGARLSVASSGGAGTSAVGAVSGGLVLVEAAASGGTLTLGATMLDGSATGGTATAGQGADATGAQLRVRGNGGTMTLASLTARSNALGGSGVTGGAATGGTISVETFGGSLDLGSVSLSATAQGGGGGGAARGGEALVLASAGSLTVTGATLLSVMAVGGDGNANAGGNASGGRTEFTVVAPLTGASLTGGSVTADASATGGRGGSGAGSNTGFAGGSGTGGRAGSGSTSSAGTFAIGALTQIADGTGGAGGSGATGGAGGLGQGGEAFGGTNTTPSALVGRFDFASVAVSASGRGGLGSAGTTAGGNGGNALGGSAGFVLHGGVGKVAGTIAATANASGGAAGTGGGGVAGTAGGGEALAVAAAHSVPGAVSRLTAGTTTLTSLALGSATQRGRALVFATAGDLTLASADLVVSGAAPGRLPSRSGLMAAVGTVAITGNASIAGSGNVVLGADAGAIAVGGTLTATAGLGIVDTIFTTPPATAGSIAVGTGRISAAGDITLSAPVTAAADLSFAGGNTVSLGNVTAAASLVISGPERITTGALRAGTGADLAGGAVTTAAITTGSGLTRIAASGTLVAGAIAAGGDVSIRAGGGVTVAAVTTPGKLGVVARGGSLVTGAIEAGSVAALLARGSVETGPISTGRTGTVFIGDAGQAGLITDDGKGRQDYTALLAAAPIALPGDVRIAGAVTTGQFQLAATGLARISGTLDTATLADIGGGTVQLGLLRSGGDVRLGAAAALSADGVQAGGAVLARGNGLTLGAVTAAGAIELVSDAAMTLGAVRGDGTIELDSGGTIRATTISAGNSLLISIDAAPGTPADIITAALDAGITAASTDPQAGYQIGLITSGGNITTGAIAARGNVGLLSQRGIITTGAVATDRDFAALARTGITTGGLKVGGSITLADAAMAALVPTDISPLAPPTGFDLTPLQLAAKPSRLAGNISVGGPVVSGSLRAAASGTVTLAGITTKGDLQLDAGRLALADLAAGGNLLLATDAPLVIGAASAGGDIAIAGAGDVSTGALRAGGSARITAQRLGTGAIRAGNDIDLASTGDLTTAALSAGDSVFLRAAASAQGRPLVTTDAIDAGTLNAFNGPGSARSVYIDSAGNAALGTITSAGAIGVTARGAGLTTGALEAATAVVLLGGQAVSTGAISTPLPGSVYLASERQASLIAFDAAGNPDYTALLAARPIRLAGDLTINGPVTTGLFKAAATGTVRVGTLAAGRDISVDGAALALAGITAGSNLALISDTTLTLGDARANGDIDLTSGGRLVAGSLSAGDSVDLVGAGVTAAAISAGITAASGDPLAQYGVGVRSTGAIDVGAVAARGPVGLVAQGSSISVGAITAGESLALLARSGVTVGSIRTSAGGLTLVAADTMEALVTETANGNADYTALASAAPVALAGPVVLGGSIDTGTLRIAATGAVTGSAPINATGAVTLRSGALALGAINAGGRLDIRATGTLALGALRGEGDIGVEAGDAITIAGISAGDSVAIGFGAAAAAGASLTTGDIDAGSLRPSQAPGAAYQVGISGRGAVRIGAITARGNIGLVSANGSVGVGAISTTAAFAGLAASGFAGTSISTDSQGTVYLANASILTPFAATLDALGPAAGFDFAPLFALAPVRIGGPLALSGAVSTGRFNAAASGAVTLAGIAAGTSATIDSGALASFGGTVTAPAIIVSSADIAITGGLGNSATSAVTLNIAATASAITLGGGNDNGSGYVLGSAEAGRIAAKTLTIAAQGSEPAAIAIQALNFAGSGAASNGRTLALVTGGSIRVNGALALTGAGAGDTLRLSAGRRIEIATDAGGRIGGSAAGDMLGGTIELSGADIWVGTNDLLGKLAANSSFAGRDAALAEPVVTPDLAGALAADRIIASAQASFLVQNSGSLAQKAGFSAGSGGFSIRPSGTTALDLVSNGRAQDAAGNFQINQKTVDVIRFASAGDAPAGFASTATVNGCSIGKICGLPPEQGGQVVGNIGNTVSALAEAVQGSSEASSEAAAEPASEEAGDAAENLPQTRLNRLVDLSVAIENVQVADPVTGEGNPTLWLDVPADSGVQP